MEWQATQAHNHLSLLPPKSEFETVAILKACIPALTELMRAGELLAPRQF
ncbi:hypothetical protein J8L86_05485 [Shewanella sp. MMG014]|nr:hypothetical protein [Shewanella sp. MMG014]MBQ4889289.1 hypothetical protein [Shewanella sp. MMG014]